MQALRFHFFKDSVKVEVLPVHLSIEKRGLFFLFCSIGFHVLRFS